MTFWRVKNKIRIMRVMNKRIMSVLLASVLLSVMAVAAMGTATANEIYFDPQDGSAPCDGSTTVDLMVNADDFRSGEVEFTYTASCCDVTGFDKNLVDFMDVGWNTGTDGRERITFVASAEMTGTYRIGTLTIECNGGACNTDLLFDETKCMLFDSTHEIDATWTDGTFTCEPPDTHTYYADDDNDGYGDPDDSVVAGSAPAGYVEDNTDCDDTNAAVHPGATEVCNGIDDDCDTLVDDADPDCVGLTTYYADADGDGYGDPDDSVDACAAPAGYVDNSDDCDDTNAAVHPGATEVCNGIDDNCDGEIDEGFTKNTYYQDADGDGYGDPANTTEACAAPAGYVDDNTDCDDTNAAVNPGAAEVPDDGIDNNCNGVIDEDFCLNLNAGWNFVSIPKMVNGSNDAETVFDIGDYDLCEYYDVHEGRWLDLDEITVEPTRGYLVSKNNPEMLCLDFSDSPLFPSAQTVYAGDFNMIGFPSMDGMSVSDFKTATGLEFSMIMQWDSGYYSTGYMTTGRGYLIWPTANGSMPGMI